MKISKSLTCTLAASAVAASAAFAPVANAELSASVGVANMYLWRGFDLGDGDAAVSGDLSYSVAGFYTGIWGSSGDSGAGSEYDLYAGWGGEFGLFSVDLSVWTYVYPDGSRQEGLDAVTESLVYDPADIENEVEDPTPIGIGFGVGEALGFTNQDDNVGDLSEVILSVGVGPVALTYYDNVAGASDYSYVTLSAGIGSFSALVGKHMSDAEGNEFEPTHLDLSYAYNDNLSFTISKFVGDEDEVDDNAQFLVSYSLPIE